MKITNKMPILTLSVLIIILFSSFSTVATIVKDNQKDPCRDYDYYDYSSSDGWDYHCGHDDVNNRNMEYWICDNEDGGDRHNPCWCHIGIHTYFIGKEGIYKFSNIIGETRHTEMCGLGNPGTEDMSICDNFDIWPIDGKPWKPNTWRWYLESSIDGVHWELVSTYPFDRIKRTTPFGPTDISTREFRFLRFRMSMDRRGLGLAGYIDNTKFNVDEEKIQDINNEGLAITDIQGKVRAHKYRSMDITAMLVQLSYDGTTDWNTVHELSIKNKKVVSFDFSLDSPTLSRFVRLLPKSGTWNGMPATPGFVDYSTITITHTTGTKTLTCEKDTMESSLSPIHPCYSGGEGYNSGSYNDCENFMMSGSFHHTYPLLNSYVSNNPPKKPSRPYGKSNGQINRVYTYSTSTTDPDGDDIYYMFDWDADGKHHLTSWQGPYSSGENVSISHSWADEGDYKIKVKAKDKYGFESDWSENLEISMPKSKTSSISNTPFLKVIYRIFPKLIKIFDLKNLNFSH